MSAGIVGGALGLAAAVVALIPKPDIRRLRSRLRRRLVRAEQCAEDATNPHRQERCEDRAAQLRAALEPLDKPPEAP